MLASVASLPSVAAAQPRCEIEEAQRLFGQTPRPTAEVGRLLTACREEGSTDYRVYMFLGVIARDSGDREQAIVFLRRARELAPQEANPALELGFTLEARHPDEARQVYEQILARDPASRPATLGLARVARSQHRLDEARGAYERLLAVDPRDPEALNGMAWLALANRDREGGRAGFEQVLAIDPGNEEAGIGLRSSDGVYRYQVEASGVAVSTEQGTSSGFQSRLTAGVTAFDALELGWRHNSDELLTVSEIGVSTLPSEDFTVGYHRVVPRDYGVSLVYDYRDHAGAPAEHWVDGSISFYVTDRLQWFGAYRRSFGDDLYDGHLIRTGLSVDVTPAWQVTATVYGSRQEAFDDGETLWSGVVDVSYSGPRNLFLTAGVGVSPSIDNLDVHGRAIMPVTDRIALQFMADHNSYNAATSVTVGLLFTW